MRMMGVFKQRVYTKTKPEHTNKSKYTLIVVWLQAQMYKTRDSLLVKEYLILFHYKTSKTSGKITLARVRSNFQWQKIKSKISNCLVGIIAAKPHMKYYFSWPLRFNIRTLKNTEFVYLHIWFKSAWGLHLL